MKLLLLFFLIAFCIGGLYQLYEWLTGDKRKTKLDADFEKPSSVLSSKHTGFAVGNKSFSVTQSFNHMICLGNSGSGKTSKVLINSLLRMRGDCVFIINDPTGQLIATAPALEQAGHEVKIVNPSDIACSQYFNPFKSDHSSIQKVVTTIVNGTMPVSKDPFFNISCIKLITLLGRILLYSPPEYQNFCTVLRMLNQLNFDPTPIDRMVVATRDHNLITEYKGVAAFDSKLMTNITATGLAALSIFSNPDVARLTSHNSMNFDDFKKNNVALFFTCKIADAKFFSILSSIFYQQLWEHLMEKLPAKDDQKPVWFIMEEASLLTLNTLSQVISQVRKFNVGLILVYQDYNQLIDTYGSATARTIFNNCGIKCYMPGQSLAVSEELSKLGGVFEFEDETGTRRTRNLILPNEARETSDVILAVANRPLIKIDPPPFYMIPSMMRLIDLPPFQPKPTKIFDTPPLIQFNED